MKTIKLISILLLLFVSACSEDSLTEPESTVYLNGQTYTNKTIGIEISAPADWHLEMNKDVVGMQALLVGTKPISSSIGASFNIISNSAVGISSCRDLLTATESYIAGTFTDALIENSQILNVNGFECAEIICHFTYNGITLKQKQILFLSNLKVSVSVTFTTEKESYNLVENDFESIIKSIKKI